VSGLDGLEIVKMTDVDVLVIGEKTRRCACPKHKYQRISRGHKASSYQIRAYGFGSTNNNKYNYQLD
jgi:hypothetical protein